jgi:hypothetical protein
MPDGVLGAKGGKTYRAGLGASQKRILHSASQPLVWHLKIFNLSAIIPQVIEEIFLSRIFLSKHQSAEVHQQTETGI